jgi:hypothetical protein
MTGHCRPKNGVIASAAKQSSVQCKPPLDCFGPSGLAMTSGIVLAMRSAPESSSRDENFFALRTDLRQRIPAVVAGILTIRVSSHVVRKKEKQGSGTPTDA